MYENQFPWFATYLMGPYVKLGRFEYQLHAYGGGVEAFRRKRDGAVLALAPDGTKVGPEGLLLREGETGWTAGLAVDPAFVTGFPVSPRGRILQSEVRLGRPEWEPYLKAGDTVLDLHIPAGGKMDWDIMVSSLQKAGPFFAKHHPDRPWKALVVTTWFMDPRTHEVLGEDSNPVKLQRSVYLYPTHPEPDSLWFVFLGNVSRTPPGKLPSATSMQRKLIEFMKSGRVWHGGGFLMLPEDVAQPSLDAYRTRFDALALELGIPPPRA
jgi:hypothetical protein